LDQTAIQALFQEFAAPLGRYVTLGGRAEAATELARNLWVALIAGPEAEEQVWQSMQESAGGQVGLLESVRACYLEEMKPVVSRQQLAALRDHYHICLDEET
jgi:hypothetical protein